MNPEGLSERLRNQVIEGQEEAAEKTAREIVNAGADPLDLLGGNLDPADDVGQALLLDLARQDIPHLHFLIRRNS